MNNILSESPLFRSSGRAPRRKQRRQPGDDALDYASPAAVAIAAVASDVERLGVPEGHRARTRAALLDLARLLDAGELSWEGLREAVGFVMEYPAVGRRILPLLIPFLDRAA